MSLPHSFNDMHACGHFYFWRPCAKQSETTAHFETNKKFQKAVIVDIGH